jgi:YHS domain-containing protein
MRGRVVGGAAAALLALGAAAAGEKSPVNVGGHGELALRGYDVVSYVTDGRAAPGRADYEYRWNGAVWRFATGEHREAFARAPERYAPQFGGYCAYAVSRGYTADIDPQAWTIAGGKLYLNYSKGVRKLWEQDVPGNIAKGTANWPGVLKK